MRLNKRIDWFRVVPAAALGAVLGGGACNNNPNPNPNPTPGGGNFTAAPATTSGAYSLPLDTVPSKDGSTFYFIAMGKNGMGIFKVAASGGAATEIVSGAPLVGPTSLSISSDDATLYIADPAAGEDETDPTKPKLGGIFSLSTGGGTPTLLPGTAGTRARGIEVVAAGSGDTIYFTGSDVATGAPGLFTASTGGSVSTVAKGAPFVDPSGVTVTKGGDAYVVNTASPGSGLGEIIKVSGGTASEWLSGVSVGYPAGIALTMDESKLLLSARDPNANTVLVDQIGVADKGLTSFNKGLEKNVDAGGLHRARGANVFAWAGVTAGSAGTGLVYRVSFN